MKNFEDIIKLLSNEQYTHVFFDVFFTAIKYPFSDLEQLYFLMEKDYNKLIDSNTLFSRIRKKAEILSIEKSNNKNNNITIDKIYNCLSKDFGVKKTVCDLLKKTEENLLVELSSPRAYIKQIYDISKKLDKRIVFFSNTPYNQSTIINVLKSCNYAEYDSIIISSDFTNSYANNIFEYSIKTNIINTHNILLFGSDESIIEYAQNLKTKTIYIPKTTDLLNNHSKKSMPELSIISSSYKNTLGFDSATSIVANKFFDNPLNSINYKLGYNCDPYFFGYFSLGLHLLSVAYWVLNESKGYKEILFLSRDGYLVKQAFDILSKTYTLDKIPKSKYIYISRRLMLPFIISTYSDLLDFPSLNISKATPKIMIELLRFCSNPISQKEVKEFLYNIQMSESETFSSTNDYYRFIREFYMNFYNKKKHTQSKKILSEYYSNIKDNSVTFDLGNYGRVQSALVKATNKRIDALFMFLNTDIGFIEFSKNKYLIKTYYDFYPSAHRSFREYIYSSNEPSCIGVKYNKNGFKLAFSNSYNLDLAKSQLQQGAIDFVKDYCKTFKNHIYNLSFKKLEMSLLFEKFLNNPQNDLKMFENSFIDGIFDHLNIAQFISDSNNL